MVLGCPGLCSLLEGGAEQGGDQGETGSRTGYTTCGRATRGVCPALTQLNQDQAAGPGAAWDSASNWEEAQEEQGALDGSHTPALREGLGGKLMERLQAPPLWRREKLFMLSPHQVQFPATW